MASKSPQLSCKRIFTRSVGRRDDNSTGFSQDLLQHRCVVGAGEQEKQVAWARGAFEQVIRAGGAGTRAPVRSDVNHHLAAVFQPNAHRHGAWMRRCLLVDPGQAHRPPKYWSQGSPIFSRPVYRQWLRAVFRPKSGNLPVQVHLQARAAVSLKPVKSLIWFSAGFSNIGFPGLTSFVTIHTALAGMRTLCNPCRFPTCSIVHTSEILHINPFRSISKGFHVEQHASLPTSLFINKLTIKGQHHKLDTHLDTEFGTEW
jgi:hypothetical protein